MNTRSHRRGRTLALTLLTMLTVLLLAGCAGMRVWGEGGAGVSPWGGVSIPVGGGGKK